MIFHFLRCTHTHTQKMHAMKPLTYLFCVILRQVRLLTWYYWEPKLRDVTYSKKLQGFAFLRSVDKSD